MDTTLALADAYQRLLGELSRRLGAARAELLLRIDPRLPAQSVARCEIISISPDVAQTLEIPISEGAIEVGRLRIEFAPEAPLPRSSELSMAQALVELATLLVEDRHQHTWGPQLQAGRRMLAVTEEELQRIILDIHDGPVQKLFAVSSHLTLVQARLEEYGDTALRREIEPIIERINGLMESALQEIRSTLSGFRLAEFEMRPLPSVLRGLAMQHEALTGNQVAL
ncbi:MAG: histidine kinase, partial [Roseiflexus sp.]